LNNLKTVVVIPALNEAKTIASVVSSLISYDIVVLVIDDGSSDNTAQLASSKGAIVVRHKENMGYEKALETGIETAINQGFDIAVTFDADGQLEPYDLQRYLDSMKSCNADLVVGIRDYRNRYTEYFLSLYGRFRFGLVDPLCGMKLYRLDLVKKYLPFDQSQLIGMEMAFRMIDSGCQFVQLPIHIERRQDISRYGSSIRGEINIITAFFRAINKFGLFRKYWVKNGSNKTQ
jgi:glycosyltransferase involved in cell wall biosynthesis